MNEQGNAGAYRAAVDAAMDELDLILQESACLRSREDQLGTAMEALKFLMGSGEQTVEEYRHPVFELIEMAAEPVHLAELTPQMVEIAIPHLAPRKGSESTDPIQRRIDSILGLAVA